MQDDAQNSHGHVNLAVDVEADRQDIVDEGDQGEDEEDQGLLEENAEHWMRDL